MTLAPAPILPSAARASDVSVTVTFTPSDPLTCTEVLASPALLDDTALLNLLDCAIARLTCYRAAYQQARDENDTPLPLPVPCSSGDARRSMDDPASDREVLEWQHFYGDAQH